MSVNPYPSIAINAERGSRSIRTVGIDVTLNSVYRDLNAFICFPPLVVTRNDLSQSTIAPTR